MGKVITLEEAIAVADDARAKGLVVVATNGCFDILHVGHARNLADSKALGDLLIVGVNSDASVKENKGEVRPIIPEQERAEMIAALAAVDYAFIFNDKTPFAWIKQLRPHIHVKGGGEDVRTHPDFAEQECIVAEAGGRIVLVPHHDGSSTTRIIKKIQGAG